MSDGLEYLAKAYFHQDYDLDAPSPEDLVKEYRNSEPADSIDRLATDVENILRSDSEAAMRIRWNEQLGAYYEPDRHGMTYREWFEKVLDVLREPQS